MKGRFLKGENKVVSEKNIYADKSSLVLVWLLREGIGLNEFSLREVAKEVGVSIGLIHKVFAVLVYQGILQVQGIRTNKRFILKKPELLLKNWLEQYSIVKKCSLRTYRSAYEGREKLISILKKSNLAQHVALALHSAAEAQGYKNTNLNTLELYVLDPSIITKLIDILHLEPQEKGYEVLLIEPYYKSILDRSNHAILKICPPLLLFLDLYHFPLRGREQAEFMLQRVSELKAIFKKGKLGGV